MTESDSSARPARRAAGLILGGLAAGALLAAAVPGQASAAEPTASIREQFHGAFTPGVVDLDAVGPAIVVGEE